MNNIEDKSRYTAPPDQPETPEPTAHEDGFQARIDCVLREDNPYKHDVNRQDWFAGWDEAEKDS